MAKSAKDRKRSILDDYRELQDEMFREKVAEIIRTQPDNYLSALEELGFKYEEEDDPEELEEKNAKPENQYQQGLVEFSRFWSTASTAIPVQKCCWPSFRCTTTGSSKTRIWRNSARSFGNVS